MAFANVSKIALNFWVLHIIIQIFIRNLRTTKFIWEVQHNTML